MTCTADDISSLTQELHRIEAHPEWGQGPGTDYHRQVLADLAEAKGEE